MFSSSVALRATLRNIATSSSSRCASTLVVSEPLLNGVTPAGTQSTITAAAKLGQPISLLVVGEVAPSKVPAGVTKVYYVANGDKLSESVASAIQAAVHASGDTTVVMGASSKFGSTVIPRAAALLNVSPITDILEIEDESK
jgi:electron transfer flavoprotein alpha subunit